jgi:hypothetical protein
MRMLQIRRGPDLRQESLGANYGGELGLEHLERDLAAVAEIVGEVHRGHSALAELALDAVPAREGGVKAPNRIRHGCPEQERKRPESTF